jgi:hypothetical protein
MLRIEIVTDSTQPLCKVDCGTDWSQPGAIDNARKALRDRFGDRVRLEYIDISNDSGKRRKLGKKVAYPLLLADGQIRLSGQFELRQVLDIAEASLEIGASTS